MEEGQVSKGRTEKREENKGVRVFDNNRRARDVENRCLFLLSPLFLIDHALETWPLIFIGVLARDPIINLYTSRISASDLLLTRLPRFFNINDSPFANRNTFQ